ncbi:MAG: molecular chaperone TorD family protein [Adlercreutzia equolifaciens]
MMQDARDNVLHTYQQWGLRVPDEFDLPEDHITLEFDLMACLADRTQATLEADEDAASRTEEGDVCSASELIAAQRAFWMSTSAGYPRSAATSRSTHARLSTTASPVSPASSSS